MPEIMQALAQSHCTHAHQGKLAAAEVGGVRISLRSRKPSGAEGSLPTEAADAPNGAAGAAAPRVTRQASGAAEVWWGSLLTCLAFCVDL